MKKYFIPVFILAITTLFISCEVLQTCLEGDGDVVTEERLGGSFTGVQCESEFKVRVEYAETSSVLVTTDENLQQKIETIVKDGKLIIRTNHDGCINFNSATEVLVKCPNLTSLSHLGSGNLEVYSFNSDYFEITHGGSGLIRVSDLSVTNTLEVNLIGGGDIWMKGRAQDARLTLSGSGIIELETFRVYNCLVNLPGSGNIHTFVYDRLEATISGSGYVYYYGDPTEVVKHISGSGDVINRSGMAN